MAEEKQMFQRIERDIKMLQKHFIFLFVEIQILQIDFICVARHFNFILRTIGLLQKKNIAPYPLQMTGNLFDTVNKQFIRG